MRTNIGMIRRRIALGLRQKGTDVTISWTDYTGGEIDPITGQRTGGSSARRKEKVKGFVHFAEARTVERRFAEIETGDCILDLAHDVELSGREAVRFTIDGQDYVQKDVAERLGQAWDAVVAGHRLFRTLLLKKAT